jgi:hypothetical protein
MLDELAIYGTNALLKAEQERGNELFERLHKNYTDEDYEGFKEMFGEDDKVYVPFIEPEIDLPFGNYPEKIKCFDEPQTQRQLYHLERWGYFYK